MKDIMKEIINTQIANKSLIISNEEKLQLIHCCTLLEKNGFVINASISENEDTFIVYDWNYTISVIFDTDYYIRFYNETGDIHSIDGYRYHELLGYLIDTHVLGIGYNTVSKKGLSL